jgi:hypothetical protein
MECFTGGCGVGAGSTIEGARDIVQINVIHFCAFCLDFNEIKYQTHTPTNQDNRNANRDSFVTNNPTPTIKTANMGFIWIINEYVPLK